MNEKNSIQPVPAYNTLGPDEIQAVTRVLESGVLSDFYGSWGSRFEGGREVRAFEKEWSEHFGAKHSISMNSATSGLIAAVAACGISPGDEVIVSPFTMTASASCVRLYGATPVFADIDENSFTLNMDSVEANITPRTKAIIFVDLAGQVGDMERLLEIGRANNLYIIEDAAQAPGATYKGKMAGTLCDIGVFSLNCHKTIQTGEGGVCCTDDDALADRLKLLRNHGEAVVEDMGGATINGDLVGYNFRMGEIEAAIGRIQLKKLKSLNLERQAIADGWGESLADCKGLITPVVGDFCEHVYYTYMMRIKSAEVGFSRAELLAKLSERGLAFHPGYCKPLYLMPLYQRDWPGKDGRVYSQGLCPVTERMFNDELFFHTYLYSGIGESLIKELQNQFLDVWHSLS